MNATNTSLCELERHTEAYGLSRGLIIALLISIAGTAMIILALSGTLSLAPARYLKGGYGHSPVWEISVLAGAFVALLGYRPFSGWRLSKLNGAIEQTRTQEQKSGGLDD